MEFERAVCNQKHLAALYSRETNPDIIKEKTLRQKKAVRSLLISGIRAEMLPDHEIFV